MFIKNSSVLLGTVLVCIKFANTVQGLDQGKSCFNNATQREGVCEKIIECERPCADNTEQSLPRCGKLPNGMPIVCCPRDRPTSSISAMKCQEYKEAACNKSYIANTPNSPPIEIKISNCAATTQPVIAGGEEAIKREFPHMALIGWADGNNKKFGCGGSLISDEFVLSAAHCFYHTNFGDVTYVRLGEHDQNIETEYRHIDLNVSEIIPHPNYRIGRHYNDIGLLRLEHKVSFTDAIRPVCLPEQPFTAVKAMATGWGYIKGSNEMNSVLMKVVLDIFDQNKCSEFHRPSSRLLQGIQESIQFCAGSDTKVNNACFGDSGGPIQISHESHFCTFTIIGVISFGQDCNELKNRSFGVYTRVLPYLSWIESIVWA